MNIEQLIELGKAYGLTVIEVDDTVLEDINMDRNYMVNNCTISDGNVWVGFFEDEEKRDASFFHEIGHRVSAGYEYNLEVEGLDLKQANETMAWFLGLREALLHGVHFSAATLAWAVGRMMTYKDYK